VVIPLLRAVKTMENTVRAPKQPLLNYCKTPETHYKKY